MAGKGDSLFRFNVGIVSEVRFCPRKFFYLTLASRGTQDDEERGRYFYKRKRAVELLSRKGRWLYKGISFLLEDLGVSGTLWIIEITGKKALVVFQKDMLYWERDKVKAGFMAMAARKIAGFVPRYVLFVLLPEEGSDSLSARWVGFDRSFVEEAKAAHRLALEIFYSGKVAWDNWGSEKCALCSFYRHCHREKSKPSYEGKRVLVLLPGGVVKKVGRRIDVVYRGKVVRRYPFSELAEVFLIGASVTNATAKFFLNKGVSVKWFTSLGRYLGELKPAYDVFSFSRYNQFLTLQRWDVKRKLARAVVEAKIHNQRRVLAKRLAGKELLRLLGELKNGLGEASAIATIRGIEGTASREFFEFMVSLAPSQFVRTGFRTRRPPGDAFNAALSFVYALLFSVVKGVIDAEGLDPYIGFLHADRHGRASLALDLMEPYRPVFDSMVLSMFKLEVFDEKDFREVGNGVFLSKDGKVKVYSAFQKRLFVRTSVYPYGRAYKNSEVEELRDEGKFDDIGSPEAEFSEYEHEDSGNDRSSESKSLMGWLVEDVSRLRIFFSKLAKGDENYPVPTFFKLP